MNKTLISACTLLFFSSMCHADALIFRGSEAQKEYENRLNQNKAIEPTVKNNDYINDSSVIGSYDLQGINGIQSKLAINEDGTFSWYMLYKKTNLETHGFWSYKDSSQSSIVMTTDPMPGDIQFKYKDSNSTGSQLPRYMAMGDYVINVYYEPKNNLDKNGPLEGVKVTCAGVYGKKTAITNEKGQAICSRVGTPLNFVSFEAPGISNRTTFTKPKFGDFSWNFTFDYEHAHTGYAFYKEVMTYSGGVMNWNGASLGATQTWEYIKQ